MSCNLIQLQHCPALAQTRKVEGFAHEATPTLPVTSIVSPGRPHVCPMWLQMESPTIPSLNSVICWDGSWKSGKHFAYCYCFLGEDIVKNTSEHPDVEVPGPRSGAWGEGWRGPWHRRFRCCRGLGAHPFPHTDVFTNSEALQIPWARVSDGGIITWTQLVTSLVIVHWPPSPTPGPRD